MIHKILVIDDNELDLETMADVLDSGDFQVKTTTDPEEGIAYVRQNRGRLSLAIVDFKIPGTSGVEIAQRLRELDPTLSIAAYSGDSSESTFETMMAAGSSYFIQKGLEARKLLAIIKTLCNRYEDAHRTVRADPVTDADIANLRALGIIGASRHLVEVAGLIHAFADADETVLIRGENGTGKEGVAQAVHRLSGRRGKFVTVNCGAIPSELMESELFGHEKGAFTNAIRAKEGLARAAHGGTLFLDEIGDLPLKLQVKILRFLQERELRPIGSEDTIKVDVRVIAATNVNLEAAVAAGKFREDLYYRIKVLPIDLLPLRERKEDVRPLALWFAQTIAKGAKKEFLEETIRILMRYDWPGNVRELEHEVRRLLITAGEKIKPSDLSSVINRAAAVEDSDYLRFKKRQTEEERQYLISQIEGKSIREVARNVLKVSYSTLQSRLKALGIVIKNNKLEGDPLNEN